MSATIDANTLQRRRVMQISQLKPVLEQRYEHPEALGDKVSPTRGHASQSNLHVAEKVEPKEFQIKRKPPLPQASLKNRDLVSLSSQEYNAAEAERRAVNNQIRKQAVHQMDAITKAKKRKAVNALLKDRQMAAELIRLYASTS